MVWRDSPVLRYPPFQRLLQVGLPSRLRGELWETLSGSICELPGQRSFVRRHAEILVVGFHQTSDMRTAQRMQNS